jgi:hypothetical protein
VRLALGLVLAIVSAVALNWSMYVQHRASSVMGALRLSHPLSALWTMFTDRDWLAGYGAGWLGWGLYVLALALAPLSLVQGVAAGGIAVLALFVRARRHGALSARERRGVVVATSALVVLAASLAGGSPHALSVAGTRVLLVVGIIVLLALLASGLAAVRGGLSTRGAMFGAAAGLCYAAGDIATKGAYVHGGWVLIPVLLTCHLLGFVLIQLAFQRGSALATAGLASVCTNALPIAIGLSVFGEEPGRFAFAVLRAVALAGAVAGAALLARAEPEPAVAPAGDGHGAGTAGAGVGADTDEHRRGGAAPATRGGGLA